MLFQTILILIFFANNSQSQYLGKCCNLGEILQELDDNYKCVQDLNLRRNVLTKEFNVLALTTTTKCLDYSQDFYEFEIVEGKIVRKTLINEKPFSKCCPIGYSYDSIKHSCQLKGNYEHNYIQDRLIEVGLPECRLILDVPLTSLDGVKPSGDYCEDETTDGRFIRRECRTDTSLCYDLRCVKKCCPDGQSFVNGSKCVNTYINGIDMGFSDLINNPEEPFAIIHNKTKCTSMFYLMNTTRYIFSLLENGDFKYWMNRTQSFHTESPLDEVGYCIEHSNRPNFKKDFYFFNCLKSDSSKLKFADTKWPKILSCIFLGLTIIIYILLNQTKKLFGKILINYCVSTLCMYALLTYAQSNLTPRDVPCQIVGFCLIFFATVSFAWLNVMCWDIWLTFGSTKHSIGVYQRRKDIKKLLVYMGYGWGMPLILTLIIYGFSISHVLPDSFRPYVGTSACFIEYRLGNYAIVVFLRLPHLLIQLVNAFLFIKTIIYCLKIKNEIERMKDSKNEKKLSFNRDKEKLFLIIKLAVIMGITFIVDTVSALVDMNSLGPFWRTFEIVIDCINCLQGVYIFIIFICKKSVYNDFLKKLHIRRRDTYLTKTENTDSFTSTTRISLKDGRNGIKK